MTGKNEVPIVVLKQYFRVPVNEWPVDYPGRGLLLESCITNISTTGLFVRTAAPLPKGTVVDIAFAIPGNKTKITARTLVRWSSAAEPSGASDPNVPVGMGLEFIDMPARQRKLIAKYVEDFLEKMRKD